MLRIHDLNFSTYLDEQYEHTYFFSSYCVLGVVGEDATFKAYGLTEEANHIIWHYNMNSDRVGSFHTFGVTGVHSLVRKYINSINTN